MSTFPPAHAAGPPRPVSPPSPGERGFTTAQIHGRYRPEPTHGSRIPPIHLTAGFVFDDVDQAEDRFRGAADGYVYTRISNPTTHEGESRIAGLEGGREAVLLASGQAATTVAVLSIAGTVDHIVASGAIYEGTRGLLQEDLGRLGIGVSFVDDPGDLQAWRAAIGPSTRLLFAESISNPTALVLDVPAVAQLAQEHAVPLVIDNTLATPYLMRPLELGAHVVVHSASKFLSGHGQALGGVIVDGGTFDWSAEPLRFGHLNEPDRQLGGLSYTERHDRGAFAAYARATAARLGPTLSPFNAFLIRRGIETLSLRMERHCANGLAVARWLQEQDEVARVHHPGLAAHPSHDLAGTLLPRGAGSVFSFELRGGAPAVATLIHRLELFSHMSHLGDVRSLIMHPATTSHVARTDGERVAAGITPGLIRVSIGIEDLPDLLADLEAGLRAVRRDAESAAIDGTPVPEPTPVLAGTA